MVCCIKLKKYFRLNQLQPTITHLMSSQYLLSTLHLPTYLFACLFAQSKSLQSIYFSPTIYGQFQICNILAWVERETSIQCHSSYPIQPNITKRTFPQLPHNHMVNFQATSLLSHGWVVRDNQS